MTHHVLPHANPWLVGDAGLSCYVAWAFGAVYVRKTLLSIRSHGLRRTVAIINMRIASLLEPFLPRTIWGENIGLRSVKISLTNAEVEQVYRWSRDEDLSRWTASPPTELTLAEFRDHLRRERWRPRFDQQHFFIVTRAGELTGKISLYAIDYTTGDAELGIFLDKKYWSRYYGREAIRLLEWYTFSETPIDRILLGTFKENVRAQRSFAACGFRVVGSAGRLNPVSGEYIEGVKMEITRSDYLRQHSPDQVFPHNTTRSDD